MKTLIKYILIGLMFYQMSYAMRCNNDLIMEGDLITKVLVKCGTPNQKLQDRLVYKQEDGMWYIIKISHDRVEYIEWMR